MTSNTKEIKEVLLEVSDSVHLCRVCYEEFNDKSKVSRILSCGHSFCTECLLNVVRASNSSFPTCPECRKLTKQTVLSLPVNFHFMQMVRKMGLSVDSPEEEVSSTAATIGREEQALGELDMHNRLDDMTMPELITQFRSILGCMKEKTSRGMYQQYSFGEPNYPLSLCMDKLSEIDDAVDIIENSLAMEFDDEDGDTHFGEDEDDEEHEDMYDTVYIFCNLRVDYIVTYHYDPNYQYYYNTPPPPQPIITYPSLPTYLLQDGTSSERFRRLVGDFENMDVVATPFDIFDSEQPSRWVESVDNDSRYTEDVLVVDANRSGRIVWRCSICECQIPQGCESSHLNGRRHNLNSIRHQHNLPIISGDEWQTMNNRPRIYRNRFRPETIDFSYNNVPIPPPHIPHSFFPAPNSDTW